MKFWLNTGIVLTIHRPKRAEASVDFLLVHPKFQNFLEVVSDLPSYDVCLYEEHRTAVFPFHPCCFEILTRYLRYSNPATDVRRDIIYDVMSQLSSDRKSSLKLDYGQISGQSQYWESIPGEEVS